jgi:hypothetical protein
MGSQEKVNLLNLDKRINSSSIFSIGKKELQVIYRFSSESSLRAIIFLSDL